MTWSPTFRPGARAFHAALAALTLATAALAPRPAAAQVADPNFPIVLGRVYASAIDGGTLYLGGQFDYIGPNTGSFACLDATTGLPLPSARVDGTVSAIVADGHGGYYLGGQFTSVSGQPRQNLAHVNADGSLAPWNPGANAPVLALVRNGAILFAGGWFNYAAGVARQHVAAIDAWTGAPLVWNADADSVVYALALDGQRLWVGGRFNTIGGQPRAKLAAVDPGTAAVDAWSTTVASPPGQYPAVTALAPAGATLYVGGSFTSIGGQVRRNLAALDATSGAASAWDPVGAGFANVAAIVSRGATVLVGGGFSTLGGATRANLAEVSASTGAATAWNPGPDGAVRALAVANGALLAGGDFANAGGAARANLAALDLATGAALPWNPRAHGSVLAIGVPAVPFAGYPIGIGGGLLSVGALTRHNLASIDLATGQVTSWNPHSDGYVRALAIQDGLLYAGGSFTSISSAYRDKLAVLDPASGSATAFNAGTIVGPVNCVVPHGQTVYVGGGFTSVKGANRANVAALDAVTGDPLAWNPGANNWVNAIAARDGRVFVGGTFTALAGTGHAYFGGVDSTTGISLPWLADAGNVVDCIAFDAAGRVYAGGWFDTFAGAPRQRIARLDGASGALSSWNPGVSAVTEAIVPDGPDVWVGGIVSVVGGRVSQGVGRIDATTGAAAPCDPGLYYMPWTLAVSGGVVYAGGDLYSSFALPLGGVAKLFPPDLTAPSVQVVSPNGGESLWENQATWTVQWTTADDTRVPWVDLEYSLTGPSGPWTPIATALPNTGTYDWPAPLILAMPARAAGGTACWLHVVAHDLAGHVASDVSDGAFFLPGNGGVAFPPVRQLALAVESNPVRGLTRLRLALPERTHVRVAVFDVHGREVQPLTDGMREAGVQWLPLPAGLEPGVYLVRATTGLGEVTRKFVELR
jgi:trimeric autotransporter adhesin